MRKFQNNTQAALDFLIGGGEHAEVLYRNFRSLPFFGFIGFLSKAAKGLIYSYPPECSQEHAEEEPEEQVRMPTTVRRVQRLKERRRAQQAKRQKDEEERKAKEEGHRTEKKEDSKPSTPKREAPKSEPQAVDLLDFGNEVGKARGSGGASDLLDLDLTASASTAAKGGGGGGGNDLLLGRTLGSLRFS